MPIRVRNLFSARRLYYAALAGVLGIVSLVYLPGLAGPFVFDDFPNILENPALALTSLNAEGLWAALSSGASGPLGRPLAMASFALNTLFTNGIPDAFSMKLTNVGIHCANTILIFVLAKTLQKQLPERSAAGQPWIPLVASAVWAVHPVQLTSVLYVVQRMNSLSCLFVVAGLIVFVSGRRQIHNNLPRALTIMALGLCVGLLGNAAKENAVLVLFYAGVIEGTLFSRERLNESSRRALRAFYGISVGFPVLVAILAVTFDPARILTSYSDRSFTPVQRLLTEARVLWLYASWIVLPRLTSLGLNHDDIIVSTGLFQPWQTSLAVAAGSVLVAFAIALRRRVPLLAFGVLWFVAGHSLESGIIGLELAHEHRNYLPSFGIIYALVAGLAALQPALKSRATPRIVAAGWVSALALLTALRANDWSDEARLIHAEVLNHPRSARSQAMFGELLAVRYQRPDLAVERYAFASQLAPTEPGYLIMLMQLAHADHGANAPTDEIPHSSPKTKTIRRSPGVWPGQSTPAGGDMQSLLSADTSRILAAQITRLLRSDPVTAYSVSVLTTTARCAIPRAGQCRHLARDILTWYGALIENPHANRRWRRTAVFVLFDLTFDACDYHAALAASEAGLRSDPDSIDYALMRSEALIALRRFTEAERSLAAIGKRPGVGDYADSLSSLRLKIDRARALSTPHPSDKPAKM